MQVLCKKCLRVVATKTGNTTNIFNPLKNNNPLLWRLRGKQKHPTAAKPLSHNQPSSVKPYEKTSRRPVEAAKGRTACNNGCNGANGMALNTWKPCVWCIWYHSTYSTSAITKSRPPQFGCHQPPVPQTHRNHRDNHLSHSQTHGSYLQSAKTASRRGLANWTGDTNSILHIFLRSRHPNTGSTRRHWRTRLAFYIFLTNCVDMFVSLRC